MTLYPSEPARWPKKRLKFCATYNDEVLPESTDDFAQIEYVEISDVSLVEGVRTSTPMLFHEAPSRARRKVREGDILVSTVRTYLKAIATVKEAASNLIASTGFCVIRPTAALDPGYAGWVAKSDEFVEEVVSRSVGVSYPAINASQLVDISVPVPPLDAQRPVAAFLDEKTAQIDALIAKKQLLLERLVEKRQTIITQAVTKGLNRVAPVKDTGVEWLGKIPVNWTIAPLWTAILKLESGVSVNSMDTPADIGQFGVLKTSAVYSGEFNASENKVVYDEEEINRLSCPVRKGEIIISRMNTPDLVGASGLVTEYHNNLFLPDRLWQTRFGENSQASPEFIYYFLNSQLFRTIISSRATGTSGSMQNISQSDLMKIKIGMPTKSEQETICEAIRRSLKIILEQNVQVENSVRLLREYRSALISAAVSGQIEGRK